MVAATWIAVVILELIHASKPDFAEGLVLLDTEPTQAPPGRVVIHDNSTWKGPSRSRLFGICRAPLKEPHLSCSL